MYAFVSEDNDKKKHCRMKSPIYINSYKCSASAGMSGGPIFFKDGRKYNIVSVISGFANDGSIKGGRLIYNYGTAIDYERFIRIKKWIENEGPVSSDDLFP